MEFGAIYYGKGWKNLSNSDEFDGITPVVRKQWYFRKEQIPPQVTLIELSDVFAYLSICFSDHLLWTFLS